VEKEKPSKEETKEENENDSTNLPQQQPLLPNRQSFNEQIEQQKDQTKTNTRGDLLRSESIRSDLTLNLSGSSHSGQMIRNRSAITTSRTTPSLSMISSLISLEAFRANKEKRQQSGGIFSANVHAQVC
jgi:hypothetical protein